MLEESNSHFYTGIHMQPLSDLALTLLYIYYAVGLNAIKACESFNPL